MNRENEVPTAENFDAVLEYLDALRSGELLQGMDEILKKTGKCGTITDMLKVLYYNNWLINSKWQNWTGIAETHLGHQELIETADVETLREILTVHVRIDRLFPGDIADIINKGYLLKIFERIAVLRKELYAASEDEIQFI